MRSVKYTVVNEQRLVFGIPEKHGNPVFFLESSGRFPVQNTEKQ